MNTYDLMAIETSLNHVLKNECSRMLSESQELSKYESLFNRASETGFYSLNGELGNASQFPDWEPNPAYMQSLESMWTVACRLLRQHGLQPAEPIRELFKYSREYQDSERAHRRVFMGQLTATDTGTPITLYMLSVSHSHEHFEYVSSPCIQISQQMGARAT